MLRPYSLITTVVALIDVENRTILSQEEQKTIIQKAHFDISEYDFSRLKYSEYYPQFEQLLSRFEAVGAPEAAVAKDLRTLLAKYDQGFLQHKYFANEHSYHTMEAELLAAYLQGNLEKTSEIADSVDLRRIPLH